MRPRVAPAPLPPAEASQYPLVRMGVDTRPRGEGGPADGTIFDVGNACPRCGAGAVQASPLILRRSELPKAARVFQTLARDVLVDLGLADVIKREEVTGVRLGDALDARTGAHLPWRQLLVDHELPEMDPETTGVVASDLCPVCHRSGYFRTIREPLRIVYRHLAIDKIPDFSVTYERFGTGLINEDPAETVLPAPWLVVKPRVVDLFAGAGVGYLSFDPVVTAD